MNASETPFDKEQETIKKEARLNLAFLSVFGDEKNRSTDQKMVYNHLKECAGHERIKFGGSRNMEFNPLIAAQLDGAESQFLIIKRRVSNALKQSDSKPKRKITK